MNDDDPVQWTLGDLYEVGGDEFKKELDDVARPYLDYLGTIDQDQLKRVRSGGHRVRVMDHYGACEVQVDIYRTGRAYGFWRLTHSPEGHEVRIEHYLPILYRNDGGWGTLDAPIEAWTVRADHWRQNPTAYIEDLVGKRIAREVGPLLQLPPTVAPDALIG